MSHPLLFTLHHLRPRQVFFQVWRRVRKARYKAVEAPRKGGAVMAAPIEKYKSLEGERLTFLNISAPFTTWNDAANGMLWAYNLNYMDWLGQPGMDLQTGRRWIDRFIADKDVRIGFDPYPIALRGINWIKFIAAHDAEIDTARRKRWDDSLYSQYVLLTRKLEYHLLGNHLLEDAFSLFVAAIYFADANFYKKATRLLKKELTEQLLPDGAHYEQSPMYHCILLDRLLDCVNISQGNSRFAGQEAFTAFLAQHAVRMLGHLDSICYADDTYPLFNDAAEGIAPTPPQIKDYARRLGLTWQTLPLGACGYRHLQGPRTEAFLDAGAITATYQPGHSHADALNYEVRLDGRPFIVDTGISTYNKTARRQYERSTAAHNTVTVADRDTDEVWSGFRVGRRAKVGIEKEDTRSVTAHVVSYGTVHRRTFSLADDDTLRITDALSRPDDGISRIHFAQGVTVLSYNNKEIVTDRGVISIEGAASVDIVDNTCSTAYNILQPIKVAEIHFEHTLTYALQPA